jgi:hypothetical protein
LSSVTHYHFGNEIYHAGDIVDIPDALFDAKVMVKVNEPNSVSEQKIEPAIEEEKTVTVKKRSKWEREAGL